MKGTRRDILTQLECWVNNEQDNHVFWLNHLTEMGKSTITQIFVEMGFADGSNLQKIFSTLSFQLAYCYPHFQEELIPVLIMRPNVGQESLCSQIEQLIV